MAYNYAYGTNQYYAPTPYYSNNANMNAGYQQMPTQPQISQAPQQFNNLNRFDWVQGEIAAKAYPVPAGTSMLLMDSEEPIVYMKSVDASGRPLPLEAYDLVKRENVVNQASYSPQKEDMSKYIKMDDLEVKLQEMVNKAVDKALEK